MERDLIAHTPQIQVSNMPEDKCDLSLISTPRHQQRKTLILDLDETLVHSGFREPEMYDFSIVVQYNGTPIIIYVQKRPGVDEFIQQVAGQFDLYIFTASLPEYSIPVVQALIPGFPTSRILTRRHCRIVNGMLVKDVSIFRRDLSDVILVDNSAFSYQLQPENGIPVSTWTGNYEDTQLTAELFPFLMMCKEAQDVRNLISSAFLQIPISA